MPQIVTQQEFSAPVLPSPQVKATVPDDIVKYGYAILPSGAFKAETPWQSVSDIMEKLDVDVINNINSVYNDKKIIKSSLQYNIFML